MLDIETILLRLNNFLKTNLPAEITAVNTLKNDDIVLRQLDEDAFLVGNLEIKNKSFNPFVLTQLVSVASSIAGPVVAKTYEIEVVMFLQDRYTKGSNWQEILRYWSALERVACKSWDKLYVGGQADVQSLAPISLEVNQGANPMKVFGVTISFTIT